MKIAAGVTIVVPRTVSAAGCTRRRNRRLRITGGVDHMLQKVLMESLRFCASLAIDFETHQ